MAKIGFGLANLALGLGNIGAGIGFTVAEKNKMDDLDTKSKKLAADVKTADEKKTNWNRSSKPEFECIHNDE